MSCGLKALKEYRCQQQGVNVYADGYLDIVEKELKALETLKDEFEIRFDDAEQEINIQSVEKPYSHIRFSLTRKIKDKDKYDLLKEVLS